MAATDKPRPAEQDIPAAVREAFSSNRLQAAWRMASGSSQGDRMPAVEAVFRILEKEGLTFEDVMATVLSIKPAAPGFGLSMDQAFSGFGDVFRDMPAGRSGFRPSPPPQPDRPRGRRHLGGSDIPATIKGTVRIVDERTVRTGPMLVFDVVDGDDRYGPIVCFSKTGIGTLKASVDEDSFVAMSVRQPNGANQNPSATNVRII